MTFVNAVDEDLNARVARTANGMKARATTASDVLDLFADIGASRGKDISAKFLRALNEHEELAIRVLLWARDARGGAGERGQFRNLLRTLESSRPALAGRLIAKIPLLGRWDDLFTYQEPQNRLDALEMYAEALYDGNGLAFKWAPREKSARRKDAADLRAALNMTPRQYRKFLALNTNVVETQMCAKAWDEINFSHVPSLAAARYQKAFSRNASVKYAEYLRELEKPEAERDPSVKINAGAVFPYDVVKSVRRGEARAADAQWQALPNYVGDARALPIVDTSGSMTCRVAGEMSAMDVAVSLGLYLSEKNTGPFKDVFLTFNAYPEFVRVRGKLSERIRQMERADWGYNTNLHAAFDEILRVATKGKVPQEDMPETLLILSDMQFDSCVDYDDSAVQMIERKYREAGYTVPKVVFWNLSPWGNDNKPVAFDKRGTCLVSGFSPALCKVVLSQDFEDYTPLNVMLQTLLDPRYDF